MTNSVACKKMASKGGAERGGAGTPARSRSASKLRPVKVTNAAYISSMVTPPRTAVHHQHHHSQQQEQRTSPGLIAGHFAGGKWSEPPSPATLPKPPQHWMQLMFGGACSSLAAGGKPQSADLAGQLKVLLNVQA